MSELIYPAEIAPVLPKPSYLNPSPSAVKSVEMLPVVTPDGVVTAQAPRSYLHGGSMLLHPVVHLHLLDRDGRIYLQKRSMKKDLLPGYWDTAVGGHISYGEYVIEALFREAEEELHLYDFNPVPLLTYVFDGIHERELVHVFAAVGNFTPEPDEDEVTEGKWWTAQEIKESLGNNLLTPNFEGEFSRIEKSLEALL